MHDEAERQQQLSRAPAPAVNVALPGVRSAQDTLAHYEHATGFALPSSSLERKAHLSTLAKLTNAAAPPIEPGALAERWRSQVAELLDAATDEASREADPDVDNLSEYVQRVLVLTGVPPAPPLSRTPSSPSSDMMDLTSDSGSLDDDTASSLQSPPPASPSMPTSGKKVSGERVHRPGSAGAGSAGSTGGPRIRRPSTASLPGTSFSSPSVSPGPPEQLLSFPSSLSLDLDYESHDSEGSEQQQHHLDRRARKQRTTRDLVDQARQQRARGADESGSSADRRSPEGEKRSSQAPAAVSTTTTSSNVPTFVHPPRAPTALPRCSADIKADEDEWWLGMDLIPPSGMFYHWMSGGDFVPRTPRLHESSMPFRFGSSSSTSSSASSPSRGIPIPAPAHQHHQQHHHQHHHQQHQHHPAHPSHPPQPPQLTSSEDFPALPSSPPRSEPPKSQPTRKWHKKTKSKSAAGTGIPTILEADEEGLTRVVPSAVAAGKRSVSASSAGSSSASVPVKTASPANSYHPQPSQQPPQQQQIQPPPPHIAAYVQQHPAMQGAPPGFPPAVPPGFAFPPGFPGAGPYGFPPGVPVPQHQQQPPQPQQPQPPMPNFAQAQGAFGPAAAAAAAAAQLFSMQQQQQGFGAPTRPPGFAGGPPPPGPPPGLRPGFAPGPHVMGMYAPHTVYATAQPVGAYYGSR